VRDPAGLVRVDVAVMAPDAAVLLARPDAPNDPEDLCPGYAREEYGEQAAASFSA